MRTLLAVTVAVALGAVSAPAAAQDTADTTAMAAPQAGDTATRDGVTLPRRIDVEGRTLTLNGMALRKKFIFKVYVAGLYLANPSSSAEEILASDTPRRVVLEFLRGVGQESMCGAWEDGLERNTPNPSPELQEQFTTLCSWMEDIEEGERMVFTYLPGEGTTIEVKGETKGTIPGKAFADALFRAWLGPDPDPGEGVKRDLLGIED